MSGRSFCKRQGVRISWEKISWTLVIRCAWRRSDVDMQLGKSQDTCPQGEYSLKRGNKQAWVSHKKARKFPIMARAAETYSFLPGK